MGLTLVQGPRKRLYILFLVYVPGLLLAQGQEAAPANCQSAAAGYEAVVDTPLVSYGGDLTPGGSGPYNSHVLQAGDTLGRVSEATKLCNQRSGCLGVQVDVTHGHAWLKHSIPPREQWQGANDGGECSGMYIKVAPSSPAPSPQLFSLPPSTPPETQASPETSPGATPPPESAVPAPMAACYWDQGTCRLDWQVYGGTIHPASAVHRDLLELRNRTVECMAGAQLAAPGAPGGYTQQCGEGPLYMQCKTWVPAAAEGPPPTFCIHRDTPQWLLDFLLGHSKSCSLPPQAPLPADLPPAAAAGRTWWDLSCFPEAKVRELAQLMAGKLGEWAPQGAEYDVGEVEAALGDMARAGAFCRAEKEADGCLMPFLGPAVPGFTGKCPVAETLEGLESCCRNEWELSYRDRNLSGVLPSSFHPARSFTILSHNPNLCGVIRNLPAEPTDDGQTPGQTHGSRHSTSVLVNNSTQCPVNLYNSSVRLDLVELAGSDRMLGPHVAFWLGGIGREAVLTYSNLQGALPYEQSIHVCTLLSHGEVHGFKRGAPCGGSTSNSRSIDDELGRWAAEQPGEGPQEELVPSGSSNCTCSRSSALSEAFRPSKEWSVLWSECHSQELHLVFSTSLQQYRAMLQYNECAQQLDPAFICGPQGREHRRRVIALLWPLWGGSLLLLFTLYSLLSSSTDSSSSSSVAAADAPGTTTWLAASMSWFRVVGVSMKRSAWSGWCFWPAARFCFKLGLSLYDVITDGLFVYKLGQFGNLYGVVVLGWVLLGSGTLGLYISLARFWWRRRWNRKHYPLGEQQGRVSMPKRSAWLGVLVTSFVLCVGPLIALAIAGRLNAYLVSQAGGYEALLLGDAWLLAIVFVVGGTVTQGLGAVYGIYRRYEVEHPTPTASAPPSSSLAGEDMRWWKSLWPAPRAPAPAVDAAAGGDGANLAWARWDCFDWDAVAFLMEDLPQGCLQAHMWLNEQALLPTLWYCLSAAGTAASIAHNLVLLAPAVGMLLQRSAGAVGAVGRGFWERPGVKAWTTGGPAEVVDEQQRVQQNGQAGGSHSSRNRGSSWVAQLRRELHCCTGLVVGPAALQEVQITGTGRQHRAR